MAPLYVRPEEALVLIEAEWRRRNKLEETGAYVVMPPLDPPPVPPEFLPEAEGREALAASRQSALGALLADWRKRQGVGGG